MNEITQAATVEMMDLVSHPGSLTFTCGYDLQQGQYLEGLLYSAVGITEITSPMTMLQ
jgi:hypothetical protein